MKPIVPPSSWRELTHAELVALLARRPLLFSKADLVWAQWEVASNEALEAGKRGVTTSQAQHDAIKLYLAKSDSKSLAAWEKARRVYDRADSARRAAERREEALYALHQRLTETER